MEIEVVKNLRYIERYREYNDCTVKNYIKSQKAKELYKMMNKAIGIIK